MYSAVCSEDVLAVMKHCCNIAITTDDSKMADLWWNVQENALQFS